MVETGLEHQSIAMIKKFIHLMLLFSSHPVSSDCTCSYFKSLADPAPIYRVSYDTSALLLSFSLSSLKDPCATTASDLRNRGLSNSWPARDYPCVIVLFCF